MIIDPDLPWGSVEVVYDERPITRASLDATRLEWLRARSKSPDYFGRAVSAASFAPQTESSLFSPVRSVGAGGEGSKRT